MTDQHLVFAVIAVAFVLFAWGRVRYDAVGLVALAGARIDGDQQPGVPRPAELGVPFAWPLPVEALGGDHAGGDAEAVRGPWCGDRAAA